MKKNILVAQSGGPTAAINASLAGAVSYAVKSGEFNEVLGSVNGIEGVLKENFASMKKFENPDNVRLLKQTPSSYLGSCRKKLPDDGDVYDEIFEIFKKHNIGAFIYIGGNDSMDTVDKLSRHAKEKKEDISVIGVPKTIDNDLVMTDHTPGYASAAKYIANSVRQLALDTSVYDMKSVIVTEIMGRNAGWLTAAAALANDSLISPVDIICLPEVPFDMDEFIEKLAKVEDKKQTTIVAVSEGICDKNGDYIMSGIKSQARSDGFAHAALGGVGKYIEIEIATRLGIKTRSLEFSTLQRCNAETASKCDIDESFAQGEEGVRLAIAGECGKMVGIVREDGDIYKPHITSFDVSLIANKEKKIPQNMLSGDGFGVSEEFVKYAKPLINGHPDIIYKDGIIDFILRD